ncbi:oxidoreductase [Mycobacterium mantenii]|uniref:Oxidoreductase n=1 Tax=Mycobacterium mantenii TaxID=560555 RepID=A0A1X0FY90_MYCNT|nr:FAD-binding oxidoreductase [Mycobacterium mantenii]MCV7246611.1 FAD-binding oxidoreductase [Mycobacterium mantenii]ORB06744.1 oxidoreductase [Mycobacterium mantenii]BBY39778.1 oxidoreductase [Mycobacterium mantenii]
MSLAIENDGLRARVSGEVILPGDPGYDEARAVHNGMIDKRPAVIARCESAADVAAALEFARDRNLVVAVRGGGHNGPGFGTVDGGLVIDLSPMNRVDVDAERRTARVQGGATWAEVDAATHAHGLAVPSGIISSTGVGGLTLGGGHGYLSRKYGLTIDNLVEAELVLADGSVARASETEHPDLFWGLRGGGGNFGVVTSFTFRLHPVHTVICGPTAWPASATADILSWYREFVPAQDEDLYGFFAAMTVPPVAPFPEAFHLQKACAVVWCYTGDPAGAEEAFAPVHQMQPAFDGLGTAPFPVLNSTFDALYPKGLQWYWRGDFFRTLDDGAVAAHARFTEELPTMHSTMHLYPIDGAVHRVGQTETALSYRDVNFSQVIAGVDPDPANAELLKRWAVDYWAATHPYSAGGAYVNFMMDEGQDRVRATYGPNYRRLTEIKAQYDPGNVFRINQNIRPAG